MIPEVFFMIVYDTSPSLLLGKLRQQSSRLSFLYFISSSQTCLHRIDIMMETTIEEVVNFHKQKAFDNHLSSPQFINHSVYLLSVSPVVRPGRRVSASASSAALLLSHPRPLSLPPLPHVDRTPQGRVVFPALDAFRCHGDTPRPGRGAPRPVGVSVWQHCDNSLLAVCQHHGHTSSSVLGAHVPDRNQGRDLHQARGGHRRMSL